jgi:hypothetical protein
MTYVTPVVSVSEKNKMKKENPGPRAETLMLISFFARTYEFNPVQKPKVGKFFVN